MRAYVGLGANLGDAPATLAAAVSALGALPGTRLRGVSDLYLTRPVGVRDQPPFHNAVVALDVPGGRDPATGALALLAELKALERAFGRRRTTRWGPRVLDLDLLVFGRHRLRVRRARADHGRHRRGSAGQWLEVPHPSAAERLFVLAPLSDLAPGLVPPGWRERVSSAAARQRALEGEEAVRRVASWLGLERGWGMAEAPSGPAPGLEAR